LVHFAQQTGLLLREVLGLSLVVPEIRFGGDALEFVEAVGQASRVKDTPAGRWCAGGAIRIGFGSLLKSRRCPFLERE
jgi:hypothetical protein